MSSKLKKVIISVVVVLVLSIGGLFVYSHIANSSDVVITNFLIVDENKKVIQNKDVYLGEDATNRFLISVDIEADGPHGGCTIYSTNESVASVVSQDSSYYVEYHAVGSANIVAVSNMVAGLYDSFVINVHENVPVDLNFSDGVNIPNKVIEVYADDIEYRYSYLLTGAYLEQSANSTAIRIVDNYNKQLFKKLEINSSTNELIVQVNSKIQSEVVGSQQEYISLQSYANDAYGNEVVIKNFTIKTNIIGNMIEDMQLVVSNSPDFDGDVATYSIFGNQFVASEEIVINKILLNSQANFIYAKVRVVYSNLEYEDVTDKISIPDSITGGYISRLNNNKILMISVATDMSLEFTLPDYKSRTGEEVSKTFVFDYSSNAFSIDELYETKQQDGVVYYEYKYFDKRFERRDAIVDLENRIIDFSNLSND